MGMKWTSMGEVFASDQQQLQQKYETEGIEESTNRRNIKNRIV